MTAEGELGLAVGDRVVYPGQGVCMVSGIAEKRLAGETLTVVTLSREEDGAQVLVPQAKIASVGVRKVAAADDVAKVFEFLKGEADHPELDWKIRHRAHQGKLALGDLMGVAEVVKSLQALSELRPLPQKERERYDNARHLLVREISVALDLPEVSAEDAVDLALLPADGKRKLRAVPLAAALGAGGAEDIGLASDLDGVDLGDLGEREAADDEHAEEEAGEGEQEEAQEQEEEAAPAPRKAKPAMKAPRRPAGKAKSAGPAKAVKPAAKPAKGSKAPKKAPKKVPAKKTAPKKAGGKTRGGRS